MGARLYDNTTGRFLTVDPVYGGNANPYTYPTDPINQTDTSGRSWSARRIWQLIGNILGTAATILSWAGFFFAPLKAVAAGLGAAATAIGCFLSRFDFECVFNIMLVLVSAVTLPTVSRLLGRIIRPMASALYHRLAEFLDYKVSLYGVVMTLVGWLEFGTNYRGRR